MPTNALNCTEIKSVSSFNADFASAKNGSQPFGRTSREVLPLQTGLKTVKHSPARTPNFPADSTVKTDPLGSNPNVQHTLHELQQRDSEVRAHEQAHLMAAGIYAAGSANYQYQKGPDGKEYAIGGHINIDATAIPGNPQKSLDKARQIRRAALAPSEPSAQDQQIAANATTMETQAQRQIEKQEQNFKPQTVVAATDQANNFTPAGQNSTTHTLQRAHNIYNDAIMRNKISTTLAPYGTGISLIV